MKEHRDTVIDEPEERRFAYTEDGYLAQLQYRERANRLILVHTEVPDALGGKGIAGRLVEAAVTRAARTGETLVPWCPYARQWLERHPDMADTVTIDWSEPPPS